MAENDFMTNLVFARNSLYNEHYSEDVQTIITSAKKILKSNHEPLASFVFEILEMAESAIKDGKYLMAAFDIALIHNFPASMNKNEWDEEWFYKGDFVGYYDNLIDAQALEKLKRVIALVAKYLL